MTKILPRSPSVPRLRGPWRDRIKDVLCVLFSLGVFAAPFILTLCLVLGGGPAKPLTLFESLWGDRYADERWAAQWLDLPENEKFCWQPSAADDAWLLHRLYDTPERSACWDVDDIEIDYIDHMAIRIGHMAVGR